MKNLGFLIISLMLLSIGCQTEQENLPPDQTAGSGDYLQISLAVKNLDQSLKFYSSLGFKIITLEKTVKVPWAIISDGTLIFMLSQNEFPSPAVIYYTENFDPRIQTAQNFQIISNDPQKPRTAIANDPNGIGFTLINLKSQYLPRKPVGLTVIPGSFKELSIPTSDLNASLDFWTRLGYKRQSGSGQAGDKILLSDNLLQIGFYTEAVFPTPTLTYQKSDLSAALQDIQSAGVKIMPIRSESSGDLLELIFTSPDGQSLRIIPE